MEISLIFGIQPKDNFGIKFNFCQKLIFCLKLSVFYIYFCQITIL